MEHAFTLAFQRQRHANFCEREAGLGWSTKQVPAWGCNIKINNWGIHTPFYKVLLNSGIRVKPIEFFKIKYNKRNFEL